MEFFAATVAYTYQGVEPDCASRPATLIELSQENVSMCCCVYVLLGCCFRCFCARDSDAHHIIVGGVDW